MCDLSNVNFKSITEITNERLGKDQSYLLDSSKVRENMDWQDKISLERGLEETFEWVDQNIHTLTYLLPTQIMNILITVMCYKGSKLIPL